MDKPPVHTPSGEADYALHNHNGDLTSVLTMLSSQFQVIQSRSQMLLTLSTLALTITGFSGPRIAASGVIARWCMTAGLVFVLLGTILLLIQTLSLRWVTQFRSESPHATVEAIINYRNQKTRAYGLSMLVIVVGLTFYVTSVMFYLAVVES